MEIIKVNDLTKRYGDFTAVDHVSFSVERGTMLAYLGVNGVGKTTVINMLATLLTPDGGEAKVCGKSLGKENEEIRRKIGIVYQQNCLDDILTVRENLMCRGMIHGATRADVWETIESLRKMEGMTVFLTTHYMEEAAGAEQIIIMDHGNILASGTPFALKEKFASDKLKLYCKEGKERQIMEMKDFLSSGNDVKGKLKLVDDHIIEAEIPATLQALPLIRQAEGMIEGFEVIQGSMDDMFLNAVGKELA